MGSLDSRSRRSKREDRMGSQGWLIRRCSQVGDVPGCNPLYTWARALESRPQPSRAMELSNDTNARTLQRHTKGGRQRSKLSREQRLRAPVAVSKAQRRERGRAGVRHERVMVMWMMIIGQERQVACLQPKDEPWHACLPAPSELVILWVRHSHNDRRRCQSRCSIRVTRQDYLGTATTHWIHV